MDPVQRSLLNAHPCLSRFDPLSRILFYDDFDDGWPASYLLASSCASWYRWR